VTDTGRVLLTAAALSLSALTFYAWRLARPEHDGPARLVAQLRLAQAMALMIAAIGALPIGIAVCRADVPLAHVDAVIGVGFILAAGYLQIREPREALLIASGVLVLHALVDIAHRPGWLSTDLAPQWFNVGSAICDAYLAALCYWGRKK
jgi:hypothetical protein